MSSRTPLVAIVGRPNVGKSTLFNRLLGRRRAIVHDRPGVTRDRIVERAELAEGQVLTLVDTGGLVPGDDPIGVNQQVFLAVEESDLLLLVVDGREGLLASDEIVWQELRRFGKPTILVVNKGDTAAARGGFHEFHRFGIAQTMLVSAEHGEGFSALREAIQGLLPTREAASEVSTGASAVAIVGRPNVGKSSLVNRLVGEPRMLVSAVPGTTRDPTDTLLVRGESSYLLIDTAGIRRRAQVSGAPEELAVLLARRQIERAEAAVLVVDAAAGITSGDLAVAGAIWEIGRAAVVAVNKWDLLEDEARERLDRSWPRLAEVLADPRRVNLSAVSGRGVEKLFPAIDGALAGYRTSLTTGELNRLLEEALAAHRPPSERGRPWKLYYATQVGSGPPTFLLFANRSLALSDSYRRYLENRLRERLDLRGIPVRLVIRKRGQRV